MSVITKPKNGRRWSVSSKGMTSLRQIYQVQMDSVIAINGEPVSFTGVPAIGAAHPIHSNLKVASYDVEEGEGADKKVLKVAVNYEQEEIQEIEPEDPDDDPIPYLVEDWGWDGSTEDRELLTGVDGTPVRNSAGDFFDRVPTVAQPASVFTKIVKFAERQGDAKTYDCGVNNGNITISGYTFGPCQLLCTVSEKRIFGDARWKYQYTIQLKYKSNLVKLAGGDTATDIGWDVAITDAGMRELVSSQNRKLRLIKQLDGETGRRFTVTTPELLNGAGKAVNRSVSDPTAIKPYNIRFQAYARVAFPNWFYSEPS